MDFHETAQEKFINRALYQNSMFAAADFIKRFDSIKDKQALLNELKTASLMPTPLDDIRE